MRLPIINITNIFLGILSTARQHHDLSISWIKAHTGLDTPDAVGNATADLLASRGRTGSSGTSVHTSTSSRSRRRPSRGFTDPRRRPHRRILPLRVLSPSHFAFYLPVPDRAVLLRVARVCASCHFLCPHCFYSAGLRGHSRGLASISG